MLGPLRLVCAKLEVEVVELIELGLVFLSKSQPCLLDLLIGFFEIELFVPHEAVNQHQGKPIGGGPLLLFNQAFLVFFELLQEFCAVNVLADLGDAHLVVCLLLVGESAEARAFARHLPRLNPDLVL